MARETRTFLAADIVGSTQRWTEDEAAMASALAAFDAVVEEAVSSAGGDLFKHTGDGFFAAFADPAQAVRAAVAIQTTVDMPTRMALATGAAEHRDGDWFGTILSRTARLMDAGSAHQVLLGEVTAGLVRDVLPAGTGMLALGRHRFRDLHEPYDVFQLTHPDLPEAFPAIRSLAAFPNNLPVQMTSFIGRDDEVAAVSGMLDQGRFVTLTGVGGVGKTRLALASAAAVLERFPGGVWLVELAPISEPGLIATETMSAMGAAADGRDPVDIVIGRCGEPTLIVLDNCEHLIDDVAKFAENVLRGAPVASVVATSREALGVMGEAVYRVPSLRGQGGLEDAVALFASRARLVDRSFVVDEANRAAIEQICRRLDGIPLAIELATARLRVLDPAGIAERLDDRFRFLTGGARTALPRQRTLAATMDWSYDLLSPKEQAMLRRLAVFAGGFDLESVEAVCSDPEIADFEVLDVVDRLVAASLVTPEGDLRFRMLETVRQYAADKLLGAGDVTSWRDRHAEHFEAVAVPVNEALLGRDADRVMARLLADHDNLRLAMTHSLESGDPDRAGRIADGLYRFWQAVDNWSEARDWYLRMVDRVTDDTLRGFIANGLSLCADNLGRPEESERWAELHDELVPEPAGTALQQAQWHVSKGNRLFTESQRRGAYTKFLDAIAVAADTVPEYTAPLWQATMAGAFLEDPPGYESVVASLEGIARTADQTEHLSMAWGLLTMARARMGDFDGAESARAEHGRVMPRDRQTFATGPFHAHTVWSAIRSGDLDAARRALADLRRSAESSPVWRFTADDIEVRLEIAADRPRAALEAARRVLAVQRPWEQLPGPAIAALALAAGGDVDSAAAVLAGVEAERLVLGVRSNPWDHEAIQTERRRLAAAGVEPEPWPMDPEHREASLERLGDAVDRALAAG